MTAPLLNATNLLLLGTPNEEVFPDEENDRAGKTKLALNARRFQASIYFSLDFDLECHGPGGAVFSTSYGVEPFMKCDRTGERLAKGWGEIEKRIEFLLLTSEVNPGTEREKKRI